MNAYEIRSNQVIEYMKLHLISLKQDSERLQNELNKADIDTDEYNDLEIEDISINGQIIATRHLLSVVADSLGIELGEEQE